MSQIEYYSQFPCQDPALSAPNKVAVYEAGRLAGTLDALCIETGAPDPRRMALAAELASELIEFAPAGPYQLAYDSLQPGHPNYQAALACARNRQLGRCIGCCCVQIGE